MTVESGDVLFQITLRIVLLSLPKLTELSCQNGDAITPQLIIVTNVMASMRNFFIIYPKK
jgi:hypothetical protein